MIFKLGDVVIHDTWKAVVVGDIAYSDGTYDIYVPGLQRELNVAGKELTLYSKEVDEVLEFGEFAKG